jgi:hypothetical protein
VVIVDLQAAETAHKRENKDQASSFKKSWFCPCNGCKKAAKQERDRILEEIAKIDNKMLYNINAFGLLAIITGIINSEGKK